MMTIILRAGIAFTVTSTDPAGNKGTQHPVWSGYMKFVSLGMLSYFPFLYFFFFSQL